MKKCGRCGGTFDESEFYRSGSRPDGLDCYCKLCRKESNMRYSERGMQRRRERAMSDPDYAARLAGYRKEYYKAHIERWVKFVKEKDDVVKH